MENFTKDCNMYMIKGIRGRVTDLRFKDLLNESCEIARKLLKNEIVTRFAMFEP